MCSLIPQQKIIVNKLRLNKVFLIAGSEPLGSAGMQADVKAITACGGFAAGAMTCIVDEDTFHVKDILVLPPSLVESQCHSFLDDVGAESIKTGALCSREMIETVYRVLNEYRDIPVVVDPVMVNSAGNQLIDDDAVAAYQDLLFPRALIITPNIREAELLLGHRLGMPDVPIVKHSEASRDKRAQLDVVDNTIAQQPRDMALVEADVRSLARWGQAVVVKSVPHEQGLCDCFYDPRCDHYEVFPKERIATKNVNGTGDSFSSAIATYIAKGCSLQDAIERAEVFIHVSIYRGAQYEFGTGYGPVIVNDF